MKLYKTLFFLLTATCLHAQNSPDSTMAATPVKVKKYAFGARAGLISSSFTHNGGLSVPGVAGKNTLNWHIGATAAYAIRKNYSARIELNYLSKGAREQFSNDKIAIGSRNALSYLQFHLLPVIIKTKLGSTTSYLALGAYYAQRLRIISKWKPGTTWETDDETRKTLNQKSDFGYSVSLGIRPKRLPQAEIRYEAGLKSVSSAGSVKNRSIILAVSI